MSQSPGALTAVARLDLGATLAGLVGAGIADSGFSADWLGDRGHFLLSAAAALAAIMAAVFWNRSNRQGNAHGRDADAGRRAGRDRAVVPGTGDDVA